MMQLSTKDAEGQHLRVVARDDAKQRASCHIGHDHPELLLVHKGAVEGHDIGVPHLMHDLCLTHDVLLLPTDKHIIRQHT